MFRVVKFLAVGIVALGLVACGKTNPAQDYSGLPTKPRLITSRASLDQSKMPPLFSISVSGDSQFNVANLYEGEQGSVKFVVTPLFPQITGANISSANLPANANGSASKLSPSGEPNTWVFTWTPAVGTTTNLPSISRSINLDIFPVTNDPRILAVNTPTVLKFNVSRTHSIPVITGIDGWKDRMNEGDSFPFTVNIYDPASNGAAANVSLEPEAFDSGINKENYKYDLVGHNHIQAKTAGALDDHQNGHWSRTFILDLTNGLSTVPGQVPNDLNSIEGVITFQAKGAFGTESIPVSKKVIIDRLAESPEFVINGSIYDYEPLEVQAGKLATISITAAIANKKGVATVSNATPSFAKWEGHPQMSSCVNGTNNDMTVQTCTITWQVPCKPSKKTYTLSLTGENTEVIINGKPKANRINKEIDITPADAACVDPVPASAAETKPAAVTLATKPGVARAIISAKRANGQSVGALQANATVGPDPKLSSDLVKKPAIFAVQNNTRTPNADDKSATTDKKVVSPNRTTQHKKKPMADKSTKPGAAKPTSTTAHPSKSDPTKSTDTTKPAAPVSTGGPQ